MNAASKIVMDLYYLLAGGTVSLVRRHRRHLLTMARFLGTLRSWVGYVGPKKSRKIFLDHMGHALPDLSAHELKSLLSEFWFYHQLRFLDLFMVAQASREKLGQMLLFDGLDHLDRAREHGRGVFVTTLHIGDPRVCHIALGHQGYPVHLLSARYDEYSPRARAARLASSRRYHKVSFLDRSLRWVFRELHDNRVIFMAVSGYGGPSGHEVSFLSRDILFSSAPARISFKAQCPVIPAVDTIDERGRHVLKLLPPIKPPSAEDHLHAFTGSLVRIFEQEALSHPSQLDWIWYVIRCQEMRGEVKAYEEGKNIRAGVAAR